MRDPPPFPRNRKRPKGHRFSVPHLPGGRVEGTGIAARHVDVYSADPPVEGELERFPQLRLKDGNNRASVLSGVRGERLTSLLKPPAGSHSARSHTPAAVVSQSP